MTGIPGTFLNDKAGILAEFSCECPLPSYKSWTETGKENFQWSTWSPQRDQWQIEIPIAESREGDELGRHIRLTLLTKAFESDILVARLSIVSTLKEPILQKEILGFNYSYSSAIFFFSSEGVNSQLNATGGLAIRLEVFKLKFTAESRPPLVQIPKSELTKEVVNWFKSEEFGDVTIESGDGQKFRFYKGILSARSEFFRLMFQSNMKEANSDVVPIPNFNSDVIGSLLLFINKDEVEDISGFAHSLYAAAHIYQLERLKSICESVLINQLSSESIVSSVRLAVLYKVENLLDNCITFLQRHKNRLSLADLLAEAMSRPKD